MSKKPGDYKSPTTNPLMKPTWRSWYEMRSRCYLPRHHRFAYYGARGITVCERWKNSFSNFLADMGPRPPGTTIERLNNNGPYCLDNCIWASMLRQNHNRRSNRFLTYQTVTLCLEDWARFIGIDSESRRCCLKKRAFEEVIEFYFTMKTSHIPGVIEGRYAA